MKRIHIIWMSSIFVILFMAFSILSWYSKGNNMKLLSKAFQHNSTIPSKYTCQGDDINPPLSWEDVPAGTKSLALIVSDPDAPMGTWIHWVVYNIPPSTKGVAEHSMLAGGKEGSTSFGKVGYGGPCPPSGVHRYYFTLYALDAMLDIKGDVTADVVQKHSEGHILDKVELTGRYEKK